MKITQSKTKKQKQQNKKEACRFEHFAFEIKKLHDFGFIVIDFSSTSEVEVI